MVYFFDVIYHINKLHHKGFLTNAIGKNISRLFFLARFGTDLCERLPWAKQTFTNIEIHST